VQALEAEVLRLSATPTPTQTIDERYGVQSFDASMVYYTHRQANIRPCPEISNDCAALETLPVGEALVIIGHVNAGEFEGSTLWYRVEGRGEPTFIHNVLVAETRPTETPTPTATPTATPPPLVVDEVSPPDDDDNGTCNCSDNVYNCSDFDTQSEAQACYQYCLDTTGKDVHRLDGGRNPNGIACESLP
jgi:hypothetical protein